MSHYVKMAPIGNTLVHVGHRYHMKIRSLSGNAYVPRWMCGHNGTWTIETIRLTNDPEELSDEEPYFYILAKKDAAKTWRRRHINVMVRLDGEFLSDWMREEYALDVRMLKRRYQHVDLKERVEAYRAKMMQEEEANPHD